MTTLRTQAGTQGLGSDAVISSVHDTLWPYLTVLGGVLLCLAGGIIGAETAASHPVRMIESGPAGGAGHASTSICRRWSADEASS